MIAQYLKTNVSQVVPDGTQEGLETRVGRALGCYLALTLTDSSKFIKTWQNFFRKGSV